MDTEDLVGHGTKKIDLSKMASDWLNFFVSRLLFREKEHLLTRTHNLILGNICCANLVRHFWLQ